MKNRIKTATPETRSAIDEQAQNVQLPSEADEDANAVDASTLSDSVVEQEAESDDSWLEQLTPYGTSQDHADDHAQPPTESDEKPDESVDDAGTLEQQQRLSELYKTFEHVDEDVAAELHGKLVEPEIKKLQAELTELQKYRAQEQQQRQGAVIAGVNSKIFAKYPQKKAETILASKEFHDYLNANNDPYSTEKGSDIIARAYYAGDADYVLRKLDGFVASRGKPKPPVSAEPQSGGGQSGVSNKNPGKKMTDAEYRAKRLAILSAPKGTYPPGALKALVNEHFGN